MIHFYQIGLVSSKTFFFVIFFYECDRNILCYLHTNRLSLLRCINGFKFFCTIFDNFVLGMDNVCTVYALHARKDNVYTSQEFSEHTAFVSCCRFIDDTDVITASGDRTVMLWDVSTGMMSLTVLL